MANLGGVGIADRWRGIDGTVSLPAISFTADADTGFFRIGAGQVGLAADGARIAEYGPKTAPGTNVGWFPTASPAGGARSVEVSLHEEQQGAASERMFDFFLRKNTSLRISCHRTDDALAYLPIEFAQTNAAGTDTVLWRITAAGDIVAATDNVNDIGALGATRPRDMHLSRNVIAAGELRAAGAGTGVASSVSYTGSENTLTARSTGVGTVKFADATARDNVGFVKIMVGTTAYYAPVFAAN